MLLPIGISVGDRQTTATIVSFSVQCAHTLLWWPQSNVCIYYTLTDTCVYTFACYFTIIQLLDSGCPLKKRIGCAASFAHPIRVFSIRVNRPKKCTACRIRIVVCVLWIFACYALANTRNMMTVSLIKYLWTHARKRMRVQQNRSPTFRSPIPCGIVTDVRRAVLCRASYDRRRRDDDDDRNNTWTKQEICEEWTTTNNDKVFGDVGLHADAAAVWLLSSGAISFAM